MMEGWKNMVSYVRKKIEKKKSWPPIEPEELRGRYVGFWARAWASFLDSLLIVMLTYPLLILAYGWSFLESRSLMEGPLHLVLSWMFPAAAIVMFWISRSATPGKMAIGARIVDAATGGKPTARQLLKRYAGYYLSAMPLGWGFLHVVFDSRKQSWHDKWSGTVVVYHVDEQDPRHATSSGSVSPSMTQNGWEKEGQSCLAHTKI